MFIERKRTAYLILSVLIISVSHGLSPLTCRRRFIFPFVSKSTHSRYVISGEVSQVKGVSRSKFINFFSSNLSFILSLVITEPSNAACLPGDVSTDCIGVYKVPIDTEISEYVSTPEKLKLFAPDLRFVPPVVPPGSYQDCIKELVGIYKENIENGDRGSLLRAKILRGDLTEVGVIILAIMPRITVAGRIVLGELANTSSPVLYRAEVAMEDISTGLGQIDVELLQAIKGQLGVITVAQLSILENLKEVEESYVDLLKVITPEILVPLKSNERKTMKVTLF